MTEPTEPTVEDVVAARKARRDLLAARDDTTYVRTTRLV